MTESQYTYGAFLSLTEQDNRGRRHGDQDECRPCWGDWLRHELTTFSIPAVFAGQMNARGETIPERLEPVFQDCSEDPGNALLSEGIRHALDQSKFLVVVCSPRSATSLQVNEQIRYFKQIGRGNRILPFVIAGEPNASDDDRSGRTPEDECFVPALRHPVMPDGSLDTSRRERESIFADARQRETRHEMRALDFPGAIELETAKIQLIAGLVGVGFNGLWGHELKRRFAEAHLLAREAQKQNPEHGSADQESHIQLLEAQRQAREALDQVVEARNEARAAEAKVLEAQQLAREAQNQLEAARQQLCEVQSEVSGGQDLPPDVQVQIEDGQSKLQEAHNQVREAQSQADAARQLAQEIEDKLLESQNEFRQAQSRIEDLEDQTRQTQRQLDTAQKQAWAAESNLLEIQQRAQETEEQLEAMRQQVREAQHQVLEVQNLPQDVKRRIEEVQGEMQAEQDKARAAKCDAAEARKQAEDLANKVLESQNQVAHAQSQIREIEIRARETQDHLAEAQRQASAAEVKVLEMQQQVREAESKLAEVCQQAREFENKFQESHAQAILAQGQIQEIKDQAGRTQDQLAEAQSRAGSAEGKLLEAQQQIRDAQQQLALAYQHARELEDKFQESQNQVRAAQNQFQESENHARQARLQLADAQNQARAAENKVAEAHNKIESLNGAAQQQIQDEQSKAREAQSAARESQNQALELQGKTLAAQRRTKVYAIIAVLALMAGAGTAVWEHQQATQSSAKMAAPDATEPELATGPLNREQIQQALQRISGVGPDENRIASLDKLAVRIPVEQIPPALDTASAVLAEPLRSHFQERLLDSWVKTNLPAAFDWSSQLTNTISRQRALEKIMPVMVTDNPTNALARLNDLKPAPGDQAYLLLFQRWAAIDPVQAIEQHRQIPGRDAGDKILSAILKVWAEQKPAAALNWLESQPDSESLPRGTWRSQMVATLFDVWEAKDLEAATAACQQLPDGAAKEKASESILSQQIVNGPASAAIAVKSLPPGDHRQRAIVELCHHWADTDAPAALTWVSSLPAEDDPVAATNRVMARWAARDPQAAVEFASQHPELSGAVLGEIASAWSLRDLPATTNWVGTLPGGEKKDAAILALANAVTDRAPRVAANLCILVTTNQPTTGQIQDIAGSFGKVDVTNAVVWARGLKDESLRQAALSALAETWAQSDPQGMAAYALSLPAGDAQTRLLTTACRALARSDFPAMLALVQPLSDGGLRQTILERAGRDCDLPHLDQMAKYISAMSAGDDQKAALKGLLFKWVAADPEAALNWLVAFPATNSQPEQVESVIKAWSQPEPAAVAQWLTNAPAGTVGDEMTSAFLEGAVIQYPEYAAQWAQSVSDETERQQDEIQVARFWMETDPVAAAKWIGGLNLPNEIQQALMHPAASQTANAIIPR